MLVRVSNNMFNMFFNPKGSAFEFKAMNSIINLKNFNKNTMNVQEKAKREEKRRQSREERKEQYDGLVERICFDRERVALTTHGQNF